MLCKRVLYIIYTPLHHPYYVIIPHVVGLTFASIPSHHHHPTLTTEPHRPSTQPPITRQYALNRKSHFQYPQTDRHPCNPTPFCERGGHCFDISGWTGRYFRFSEGRLGSEYGNYYTIARPVSKTCFCLKRGGIFEYIGEVFLHITMYLMLESGHIGPDFPQKEESARRFSKLAYYSAFFPPIWRMSHSILCPSPSRWRRYGRVYA